MIWTIFLLLLDIQVHQFCGNNLECVDIVRDCVIDGETLEFCKKDYGFYGSIEWKPDYCDGHEGTYGCEQWGEK